MRSEELICEDYDFQQANPHDMQGSFRSLGFFHRFVRETFSPRLEDQARNITALLVKDDSLKRAVHSLSFSMDDAAGVSQVGCCKKTLDYAWSGTVFAYSLSAGFLFGALASDNSRNLPLKIAYAFASSVVNFQFTRTYVLSLPQKISELVMLRKENEVGLFKAHLSWLFVCVILFGLPTVPTFMAIGGGGFNTDLWRVVFGGIAALYGLFSRSFGPEKLGADLAGLVGKSISDWYHFHRHENKILYRLLDDIERHKNKPALANLHHVDPVTLAQNFYRTLGENHIPVVPSRARSGALLFFDLLLSAYAIYAIAEFFFVKATEGLEKFNDLFGQKIFSGFFTQMVGYLGFAANAGLYGRSGFNLRSDLVTAFGMFRQYLKLVPAIYRYASVTAVVTTIATILFSGAAMQSSARKSNMAELMTYLIFIAADITNGQACMKNIINVLTTRSYSGDVKSLSAESIDTLRHEVYLLKVTGKVPNYQKYYSMLPVGVERSPAGVQDYIKGIFTKNYGAADDLSSDLNILGLALKDIIRATKDKFFESCMRAYGYNACGLHEAAFLKKLDKVYALYQKGQKAEARLLFQSTFGLDEAVDENMFATISSLPRDRRLNTVFAKLCGGPTVEERVAESAAAGRRVALDQDSDPDSDSDSSSADSTSALSAARGGTNSLTLASLAILLKNDLVSKNPSVCAGLFRQKEAVGAARGRATATVTGRAGEDRSLMLGAGGNQ